MINLNFQTDDNQINDFIVVCEKFNQRPHRLVIHESYTGLEFQDYINSLESLYQNHFTEMIPQDDDYIQNQRILRQISETIFISYLEIDRNNEEFITSEVIFYYQNVESFDIIQKMIDDLSEFVIDFSESEHHKVNFLTVREGHLTIEPIIGDQQENCELFYNSNCFTRVEKLIKKIKKTNTGLSILYGENGNGKSQLSKFICHSVDQICIYIPLNLIDQSINNPEFINFLKKWGKVLLVIDDCDFLCSPIFGKTNYFTHNLLQLVDGFYNQVCQIQTLLIFNTDTYDDLDQDLVESNSIIDVIEITELTQDESNQLAEHLNLKKRYKQSSRVIEVVKGKKPTTNQKLGLS
jgi:hypothetical protein